MKISMALGMAMMLSASQAALPTPLVNLQLDEGSGETSANKGSLEGSATLVQTDGFPLFTNAVPAGPFAPANNTGSVDFGNITASGQGGRAIDLASGGDGTLGTLNAFTVCGWLNARNLAEGWGGNRIAFALAQPNGPGFDLVQLANGALRIGINQWPDAGAGGPSSSTGKVKADPQTGASNWVFFAVTYDSSLSSGNVKYYFGNPNQLASLDKASTYLGGQDNGGLLEITGMLTLGNFGEVAGARYETGPTGGSRVFRGLIDELRVYDQALDLAQVQQAQLNGATPGVAPSITRQPASSKAFEGQPVTFRVEVTGTAPFSYQWQRNGVDIPGATSESYILPSAASADNNAIFRVKVSNAVASNIMSESAQLQVLPENGKKVFVSFSDGSGFTTNQGNLGGVGAFVQKDGYPAITANVPAGSFAPSDNVASVDFGVIEDAQGGRAIDFTNSFDNTVGPMTGFTVSGWLNCRDLTEGWGGNRIAFALASPGGPGFDVVQLADGALRLGVNQWPDAGAGGPRSSAGMITADPNAPADNWVFFAVTYDSALPAGQVNYYFGKGNQAAQLDVTADYDQGPILQSGPFTIGNFSSVDTGARNGTGNGGGSRVFRGLIDEIHVFNKTLSLSEIAEVQKTAAYKPATTVPVSFMTQPQSVTVFEGSRVTFQVSLAGTPPINLLWKKKSAAGVENEISGATNQTLVLSNVTVADNGSQYWAVASNSAGSQTSQPATLTVVAENNQKVVLSFSEGNGALSANQGNLGGSGTFTVRDNYPAFSTSVPSGAYAPSGNNGSIDFGVIADGQGGRAIDYTNGFGNTLGSMSGFTLTGWLNSRDLQAGGGGNRVLFALASPAGPGFDLVQNADGSLQLGVNQWPDGSPATSSAGKISADPDTGAANWVFFAVTYDGTLSSGNANFYFGSPSQAAELDFTTDYDRGPILTSGPLTVGNFGAVVGARNDAGPGGSRVFRGLMDELKVFNKVLSVDEIRTTQKAAVVTAVSQPKLLITRQAAEVMLQWESIATFQLQSRAAMGQGDWATESIQPIVDGSKYSVRLPISGISRYYRLVKP